MKLNALPAGLFVEAAKLTSRKEDLFTLALASALSESADMGRGFVEILFGAKTVQGVALRSATLEFEVQVIPSRECRLDMLIRMNGAALIALEHKLWSPEGNNQVSKYLCLPKRVAPLVAYVAGYYATRLSGVDSAPKRYLRHPSKRLHFVWADFYDLVAGIGRWKRKNTTGLQAALNTMFDQYLFQPTHWSVSNLNDADPLVRKKADERVAKMFGPTMAALGTDSRGYYVASSWTSLSEFYATDGKSSLLPEIRVDPRHTPGALKVVLKCRSESDAERAHKSATDFLPGAVRRASIIPPPKNLGYSGRGNPYAVEILTPWSTLLGRYSRKKDLLSIGSALKRHVIGIVDAVR